MDLKERFSQAVTRANDSLEKAEAKAGIHQESERCWCSPEIKRLPNGNQVIVHNRSI